MDSRPYRTGLFVAFSYLLLTFVATYPAWVNISHRVIGPEEDNQQNCWTVWWYQKALFEDHVSPWHCHLMFYPFGASLGLHDVGPAYAIPGALIAQVAGVVAAYNILILLSFVAAGFAAYLLAYDMGFRWTSAWTAGVVFAFSPFLPVHAQHHLQLTGIHWFPLLSLALRRTRADSRWRWPILSGVFFAMAGLSSLYFAVFAFLLLLVFMGWNCYADRKKLGKLVPRVAALGLVSTMLLAPRGIPALTAIREGGEYLLYGASDYCADLLGLVLPPSSHPLWGEMFRSAHEHTTGSPWEFEYVGLVPVVFAAWGLFSRKRYSVARWLMLAGGAVVLAFGPLLHASGKVILVKPLPYSWLIERIPLVNGIRVPVRFTILAYLGLAVATAGGVEEMSRRVKIRGISLLVGMVAFLDFLQAPLETIPSPKAPAHDAVLSRTGPCAILDVPVDDYATRLRAQYLQIDHCHPTVTGVLGRDPGHAFALIDSTPVLRGVFISDRTISEVQSSDVAVEQELRFLSRTGIGGIIFHRNRLPPTLEEERLECLIDLLGPPLYSDSLYLGWALEPS